MKILGYSERGAMNALFYGMKFNAKGEEQMWKFLELAKIDAPDSFFHFEIYNEFSLSEFGNPDLVIIAQKENKKFVFFVESKVSNGTSYDLDKQKEYHEDYVNNGNHENGHASNLFFQFRLKHFFFSQKEIILEDEGITDETNESEKITKTRERFRKIGKNPIVIKFVQEIKECVAAYYIAIIPKQEKITLPEDLPETLKINFVSWEDICKSELKDLVKETIKFNQDKNVSLILNKPIDL